MSIQIPERLSNKLKDTEWLSNVDNVKRNVEALFARNHPYFFEEYTEHGEKHINHILEISDKLIHEKTLETITAKTLGIYLISAMLHDVGMYLVYDNLKAVIEDDNLKTPLLDKYSMKGLWEKYLIQLKRYTDRELLRKFGKTNIYFDSLPEFDDINTIDKLVVGEFIRQNHHTLSHYIINNVVELGGSDILKNTTIDDDERDLIGLVARSHGVNLRGLEEYLDTEYSDLETPNGIEMFYIMSLLRLADYLDAGEERASHLIEEMYVQNSEISKEEFAWNQCIKYDNYNWKFESQKIVIQASPKNGYCFSKVTKWVNSVQQELDVCWAIISEFYNVNKIKLSIRRVDCNVSKDKVIEKAKQKFYPDEVNFEVNPDILKLLIQPLYGDDPSYGVRELVQNAVDACREREEIEKSKGKSYSGEIKVNIDTKEKIFTIEDNGVGMTVDTIVNYYLKAGSSYRRSSTWADDFLDNDGNSKVLRTGKFGVGVLATFLLGNEATITTKNINEDKAWKFTIKLEQDNIEITRTNEKTTPGTIVSIKLSDIAISKLKKPDGVNDCEWYQWYVDSNPTIQYEIDAQIKERTILNPTEKGWFELEQNEYEKYYWNYGYYRGVANYCNGIVVSKGDLEIIDDNDLRAYLPQIYIKDKKGNAPVNLSRSKFTETPCYNILLEECFKYYIAQILNLTFDKISYDNNIPHFLSSYETRILDVEIIPLIHSENGFYPIFEPFRKFINITNYKIVISERRKRNNINKFDTGSDVVIAYIRPYSEIRLYAWRRLILDLTKYEKIKCIFIKKSIFDESVKNVLREGFNFEKIKYQAKNDYFVLTRKDDDNDYETDLDVESIIIEYHDEYSDDESDNSIEYDIMMKVIKEYFPENTWIPYDMEERKRVFSKAFKDLEKYM